MTRMTLSLLAVLGFTSTILHAEEFQVGNPSPNIPQLGELKRFEGKWEAEIPNSNEKMISTRKWVLNGTCLFHEFELTGGAVRGRIYRGFDPRNDHYTLTVIDSLGNVSMLTGYWEETLNTMIFDAIDSSCFVQHYESQFPDGKTEQWSVTLTGGGQFEGTAKRVSD